MDLIFTFFVISVLLIIIYILIRKQLKMKKRMDFILQDFEVFYDVTDKFNQYIKRNQKSRFIKNASLLKEIEREGVVTGQYKCREVNNLVANYSYLQKQFINLLHENIKQNDEHLRMIDMITRSYEEIEKNLKELEEANIGIVKALAQTVELKDRYTIGHSERVAQYSVRLGQVLGFDKERLKFLKKSALLHDIGKIGIPDSILNKPARLTDEEYEKIKRHTIFGERLLKNIDHLKEVGKIVRYHHERWDGTGYPDGLSRDNIPLESRIISIFDAFDTIVTKRSYKDALEFEAAIKEIEANAGSQFDPQLASKLLEVISKEWSLAG